jgi:pimeloyl-ACP methyl ester carboxylesterase
MPTLSVDGAELHYGQVGTGPTLLLLSGGIGAAADYAAIAPLLADEFTVLTYDRRGHFASTGGRGQDITIAAMADDAVALLRSVGSGPSLVFGSSAGGVVGLDLAARYPDLVVGLIAHEAPVVNLIDDGAKWSAWVEDVCRINDTGETLKALAAFRQGVAIDSELPPAGVAEAEWDIFFRHEQRNIVGYQPDLPALGAHGRVRSAVGVGSGDYWHARTSRRLAEHLGQPCAEFPGAHLAYRATPKSFRRRIT